MTFDFATYATLSAIELQFPTGDTYKFDLQLYNENRDPFATLAVRAPRLAVRTSASPEITTSSERYTAHDLGEGWTFASFANRNFV